LLIAILLAARWWILIKGLPDFHPIPRRLRVFSLETTISPFFTSSLLESDFAFEFFAANLQSLRPHRECL
jgi:hypothetical protein